MELGLIFLTGLFLSLHCVGMCGGFVALVSVAPSITTIGNGGATGTAALANPPWRRAVLPQQLVFNAGRIATYTLLGAMAGALGSFTSLISKTGRIQALLMISAGVLMVGTGLALAGLMKHWSRVKANVATPQPWLARGFEHVTRLPRPMRALPLGALLGFLPCGLIYAMLAKAASSGSALLGALVMLTFGFGTVPALLLVAFFADLFSITLRDKLVRVSGVLLGVLGAITLYRGFYWLAHPMHNPVVHDMMHHF
jgi:sulfite exporter TauE/SafE